MCGIAGIVAAGVPRQVLQPTLQRMTGTLVHRGPDDDGFFVAGGIGLGMRRLSIIDVAGGRQPLANEDGTVHVIFNGEIYNYPELRAELEAKGHCFRSHSDTEVIAHAYEEDGVECIARLRGMFAIALWDARARRLLLVRDRLGKKPLFYAEHGAQLLFGSEIKAILAAAPELAEPDVAALVPYLRNGFVCEPHTMFRRIHKLPAAHRLVWENGRVDVQRYWRLPFDGDGGEARSAEQWSAELDALLQEAVRIRLMSEVPLGVFLSGGLDSSTIVAYAHKAGLRPIKTFTIGFDRPAWDESADAERVARHFHTEHHVLMLREADLVRTLPETVHALVRQFDEPFGDSSALPTYHVSRLAREHVTVILSGDGGDELLAGYQSYQSFRFAEVYRRLPAWLAASALPALAEGMAPMLPRVARYQALRAGKVLHDAALPFERGYFSKFALCSDALLRALLTPDLHPALAQPPQATCPADIVEALRAPWPLVNRLSYADLRFRLLEDMLVKVDRMSMAHSLEVRSPLLDHRVVEFLARMPAELKLRGWQKKAILRDTVRAYLPAETLRKRKQGFSVPLREWLHGSLNEMVGDYLDAGGGRLPPALFNRAAVSRLLAEHGDGVADHSTPIWLLLNYAAWDENRVLGVGR
jgi:asparagine synthase (glutamine-hydrolysing)